jgi:hypothetical protein
LAEFLLQVLVVVGLGTDDLEVGLLVLYLPLKVVDFPHVVLLQVLDLLLKGLLSQLSCIKVLLFGVTLLL